MIGPDAVLTPPPPLPERAETICESAPPKIEPTNSRKALGPNRITGDIDGLRNLIRPPMAHTHPDIAAKVVADDAADSGDPPTQTGSPVEERRMRIDGARKNQ